MPLYTQPQHRPLQHDNFWRKTHQFITTAYVFLKRRRIPSSLEYHPEKALDSDIDDVTCHVGLLLVIYSPFQQIIICIDFHADGTCAFFQFFFFNFPPFFFLSPCSSCSSSWRLAYIYATKRREKSKKIENKLHRFILPWIYKKAICNMSPGFNLLRDAGDGFRLCQYSRECKVNTRVV